LFVQKHHILVVLRLPSDIMPTSVFKDTPSTSFTQIACAEPKSSHDANKIRPEGNPHWHEASESDSDLVVPVVGSQGASPTQTTTCDKILQLKERKRKLIASDRSTYILDSFCHFIAGDPDITPSGMRRY
jgi:hypothetical protein